MYKRFSFYQNMSHDNAQHGRTVIRIQAALLLTAILLLYSLRLSNLWIAGVLLCVSIFGSAALYTGLCCSAVSNTSVGMNAAVTLLCNILVEAFLFVNRALLYTYVPFSVLNTAMIMLALVSAIELSYLVRFLCGFFNRARAYTAAAFLLIMVVHIAVNLRIFRFWPRWDSYAYLFDFYKLSADGIFHHDGMHVAQHLTNAYGLLAVGVQAILGRDMRQVLVAINLGFVCAEFVLFFWLFRAYTPRTKPIVSFLFALAFALSPYMYGSTSSLCLENFMIMALALLLYADATDNDYLLLLGAFMLCNSKENGVVITCAVMIARILRGSLRYWKTRNENRGVLSYLKRIDIFSCCSVALLGGLWFLEFKQGSWTQTNDAFMPTVDGSTFNSVSLSRIYIGDKLKTLFMANFNWIFVIILVAAAIVYFVSYRKKGNCILEGIMRFIVPLAAAGAMVAFSLVFVTYNHFRYWAPTLVPIYLLAYCAAIYLCRKQYLRIAIPVALSVLLCTQSYTTIDPVMLATFGHINTGKTVVVSTADNVIGRAEPTFLDACAYNHQIMYFDEAYDLVLEQIKYSNSDTAIVVSGSLSTATVGGTVDSLHMLSGFGYQYMDVPRYVTWSHRIQRRVLTSESWDAMNVYYYSQHNAEIIETLYNEYEKVYYIQMPFMDTSDLEKLQLNPEQPEICVEHYGWRICAYALNRR